MGVDPKDPILKRVLRAKNAKVANEVLDIIVDEEAEKYKAALRPQLIKQFGINAGYFGKAAVNKIWKWFHPPMDFNGQPAVMPGATISMSLKPGGDDETKIPKKARRNRS